MNRASKIFDRRHAIALLAIVATAACQTTTRTDVSGGAVPATVAGAGQQHTPGTTDDSTRRYPAASAMGDSARPHEMDPDTRFMHHMIAHHAQALAMTDLVPARGTSQGFGLFTERIEISQNDEIALMRRWLEQRGKPVPAPGEEHQEHLAGAGSRMLMPGMLTEAELARLAAATGSEFERLFLEFMIRHHEGALTMVAELFASQGAAQDSEIFRLASDIDADQRAEISRMRAMLNAMPPRPPG